RAGLATHRVVFRRFSSCGTGARSAAHGRIRQRRGGRTRPSVDLRQRRGDRTLGVRVSRIRAWLDASPIADLAITLMREATGRTDPIEPLRPTRPAALTPGRRVAFWSLVGGVGASTTAGLVAHRSAAGGHAPLLIDLDRWAPSLALRARIEAATIADALVQPGRERRGRFLARAASVYFYRRSGHDHTNCSHQHTTPPPQLHPSPLHPHPK